MFLFLFLSQIWLLDSYIDHPVIFGLLFMIWDFIVLFAMLSLFTRKKKKKTVNRTPAARPNLTEKEEFDPDEISRLITDKIEMIFGETATWKWQSDKERNSAKQTGHGFIVVTNDNGQTTIYADVSDSVRLVFASFEPFRNISVDYSLVAFEWVRAHFDELMTRFNDSMGEGSEGVLLPSNELPEEKSWIELCKEIENNGEGFKADVCEDGILVRLPC